jgi:hypothetical protein
MQAAETLFVWEKHGLQVSEKCRGKICGRKAKQVGSGDIM